MSVSESLVLDKLTLIITTSPIRSHPSPSLLVAIAETFHHANIGECRKVFVCDGHRFKSNGQGRKHQGEKAAMRSGYVTNDQAANYDQFKVNLRAKIEGGEAGFTNAEMLELESRHGYGFALKEALKLVQTDYVMVIQHDRSFMRKTPVRETLAAMEEDGGIKYVGILMRSNLMYLEQFIGKYGKRMAEESRDHHMRRPEALLLPSKDYACDEVAEELLRTFPRCTEKYTTLREAYRTSPHYSPYVPDKVAKEDFVQASLIPTFFWYDNIHIVRTEHYRDWVFDPEKKLVARGGFVEDKLSPKMVTDVKDKGMAGGWGQYGCFLLDDHCGVPFTGHLDGGSWMTDEERVERRDRWDDLNNPNEKSGGGDGEVGGGGGGEEREQQAKEVEDDPPALTDDSRR